MVYVPGTVNVTGMTHDAPADAADPVSTIGVLFATDVLVSVSVHGNGPASVPLLTVTHSTRLIGAAVSTVKPPSATGVLVPFCCWRFDATTSGTAGGVTVIVGSWPFTLKVLLARFGSMMP